MNWPYDHPRKGSCVPGCPSYKLCHCGCEGKTSWSHHSDVSKGLVKDRPTIFMNGHAGARARWPGGKTMIINCRHTDREHKARGMCKNCYDNWHKKNRVEGAVRKNRTKSRKLSPSRKEWERKRHNRFLSLFWKHGYGEIATVFKILDEELPLPEGEEVV